MKVDLHGERRIQYMKTAELQRKALDEENGEEMWSGGLTYNLLAEVRNPNQIVEI